ncbi:MAG: YraN family protein [Acidimicrobiales bacterium]
MDARAVPNPRKQLGDHGEQLAAAWYSERGYRVLVRNWRCRNGELDLVLARRDEIVFCEVKTRSSRRFGHPVEAVTRAKQLRIRRLAVMWLKSSGTRSRRLRFDVAAVEQGMVEVWRDAF